jgi:DNA-binding NarL/FixJ family response regulator
MGGKQPRMKETGIMGKKIRVMIVDGHAILREGLKLLLAETSDIAVTAEAGNGLDAIQQIRQDACDVVLLEVALPDRDGIDVLKQVRKEAPHQAVLMLSGHREDQYGLRALKAGALGYLNKQCTPAELQNAIRQVAAGRKYISLALAQQLASHVSEDRQAQPHETLSDREYQTLTMIASGKAVSDIARELLLSVKTVSMYRARILAKMKLRHNAELTYYAISNRLV